MLEQDRPVRCSRPPRRRSLGRARCVSGDVAPAMPEIANELPLAERTRGVELPGAGSRRLDHNPTFPVVTADRPSSACRRAVSTGEASTSAAAPLVSPSIRRAPRAVPQVACYFSLLIWDGVIAMETNRKGASGCPRPADTHVTDRRFPRYVTFAPPRHQRTLRRACIPHREHPVERTVQSGYTGSPVTRCGSAIVSSSG